MHQRLRIDYGLVVSRETVRTTLASLDRKEFLNANTFQKGQTMSGILTATISSSDLAFALQTMSFLVKKVTSTDVQRRINALRDGGHIIENQKQLGG